MESIGIRQINAQEGMKDSQEIKESGWHFLLYKSPHTVGGKKKVLTPKNQLHKTTLPVLKEPLHNDKKKKAVADECFAKCATHFTIGETQSHVGNKKTYTYISRDGFVWSDDAQ